MARLEWQDTQHALQTGMMDAIHHEFMDLINALTDADDATESLRLDRLLGHCLDHFTQEMRWLTISHMPDAARHVHDHEIVLDRLDNARAALRAGQHGAGRETASELALWFRRHAVTQDAALAFQLQQRTYPHSSGIRAVG